MGEPAFFLSRTGVLGQPHCIDCFSCVTFAHIVPGHPQACVILELFSTKCLPGHPPLLPNRRRHRDCKNSDQEHPSSRSHSEWSHRNAFVPCKRALVDESNRPSSGIPLARPRRFQPQCRPPDYAAWGSQSDATSGESSRVFTSLGYAATHGIGSDATSVATAIIGRMERTGTGPGRCRSPHFQQDGDVGV
jgi:hypothetical protein